MEEPPEASVRIGLSIFVLRGAGHFESTARRWSLQSMKVLTYSNSSFDGPQEISREGYRAKEKSEREFELRGHWFNAYISVTQIQYSDVDQLIVDMWQSTNVRRVSWWHFFSDVTSTLLEHIDMPKSTTGSPLGGAGWEWATHFFWFNNEESAWFPECFLEQQLMPRKQNGTWRMMHDACCAL